MRTSFLKKQWAFFASFAFVFAVVSACSNGKSSNPVQNDDTSEIESTDSGISSEDQEMSSAASSSSEEVSEASSSSYSSDNEEESSSSKNVSSSSKGDTNNSSVRISLDSLDIVPLDTIDDACDTEGDIRYFMVSKRKKIYEVCHDGKWVETEISSSSASQNKHYQMDSLFNPDVQYATFIDKRDSQTYKIIEMGDSPKLEVFAQNLNYGKQIMSDDTIFKDDVVEKYCYNDDAWYCDNGFGGLYSWSEAMGLPRACDSVPMGTTSGCSKTIAPKQASYEWDDLQVQGICPEGWHILNKNEWEMIVGDTYIGDHISRVFGNDDDYGFSALPAGLLSTVNSREYEMMPEFGYMWLPEEYNDIGAYAIIFNLAKWFESDNERRKTNGMSVRCVKNYRVN